MEASEKQIKFMKSLGIDTSRAWSMQDAKQAISEALAEQDPATQHNVAPPAEKITAQPSRDVNITSQCLTKCVIDFAKHNPSVPLGTIQANVLTAYNYFIKNLN